jgi:hypothetical protein
MTSGATDAAAACAQSGSDVVAHFTSADDVRARVSHRWVRCDGGQLTLAHDEAGIDVTADGHWYTLVRDASGSLSRGSGFDYEGTYEILDTSSFNGPGSFQVTWWSQTGQLGSHLAFVSNPTKMRAEIDSPSSPPTYAQAD